MPYSNRLPKAMLPVNGPAGFDFKAYRKVRCMGIPQRTSDKEQAMQHYVLNWLKSSTKTTSLKLNLFYQPAIPDGAYFI
jgi:hypothetical protein